MTSGASVGVKADVSTGLKLKTGATSGALDKSTSTRLLESLVDGRPPPAALESALSHPSQRYVEAGVFLNGSITLAAPAGPSVHSRWPFRPRLASARRTRTTW